MKKNSYKNRIRIPLFGKKDVMLFTKGSLRISTGYDKIVFDKKPKVVILEKDICLDNLFIPQHLRWKEKEISDHIEYRSNDYCRIKIRFCKKNRTFCCSLFDVFTTEGSVITKI